MNVWLIRSHVDPKLSTPVAQRRTPLQEIGPPSLDNELKAVLPTRHALSMELAGNSILEILANSAQQREQEQNTTPREADG